MYFFYLLCVYYFLYNNTATEAERRFKSIREKYRRRKILLERDVSNNVEHSKLKRWDLYSKLGFLDDYMIPRKLVLFYLCDNRVFFNSITNVISHVFV